jgi:4-hydroxybenzoate polyprenyltransferase
MHPATTSDDRDPSANTEVTMSRIVAGLIVSARPRQWIKNLACFAGVIFSGRLVELGAFGASALAFVGFCLASSSVYLINDVCDRRADAENPKKRGRPIAAGLVPVGSAIWGALGLGAAAFGSSMALPAACRLLLGLYLAMGIAYSVRLKHTVLLDVILIAIGFVMRVLYGVFAVRVAPTPWIVLCMFFLALFLGFAKRRSEIGQVDSGHRRPVLRKYRTDLLDMLLAMTATMSITCYALYTITGRPENATLVVTVPLVVYGVYRYLLLVVMFDVGDAPDRDLFDDLPLIATGLLWVVMCVIIIYFNINIIHLVPIIHPIVTTQ